MTTREFIQEVINLYKEARKVNLPNKFDFDLDKLRRGRNHVISSQTEDLFAFFISKKISTIEKILIDQPISFQSNGQTQTLYPDIILLKNNKIITILDIKMDLGRKRDKLEEIYKQAGQTLDLIYDQSIWYRDGITKERFETETSKNISYEIVIITNKNINKSDIDLHLKNIKKLGEIELKSFFLSEGFHPNRVAMEPDKHDQIEIRPDFDKLVHKLKMNAQHLE